MDEMDHTEAAGAGSTRERILEVALDLFTDQGFDKTSLREIADRVGVTKAALYYHFPSKEKIFSALVERVHGVGHHGLDLLPGGDGPVDMASVEAGMEALLDQILAQRHVFVLMDRNRAAMDSLSHADPEHDTEHQELEQRWSQFASNSTISLHQRVRVLATMGAIMAGAIGSTRGLGGDVPDGMRDELVAVIRELLGTSPSAPSNP
jgi:AcrR family transcriptional regulator